MLGLLFSFVKNELETPILDDQFCYVSECDISVSKLLGFEKIWYRKKYWYLFRKKIGIEKSAGIGFEIFCIERGHKYS